MTTGGKKYDKYFIYVPTEVANDSHFPLGPGDLVSISVNPKRLSIVIEKV